MNRRAASSGLRAPTELQDVERPARFRQRERYCGHSPFRGGGGGVLKRDACEQCRKVSFLDPVVQTVKTVYPLRARSRKK